MSGFPIINTTLGENYSSGLMELIVDFVRRQKLIAPNELGDWRADLVALSDRGEYFFSTVRHMFWARKA